MTPRRDSGQIGVVVVALAAVALVVVQGLVRFGDALVDAARAQSVADAVALAVAAGHSSVSEDLIDDHDATIVSISGDDEVTVRVSVGGRTAEARAATTP